MKLAAHPRLYISDDHYQRASQSSDHPVVRRAAAAVRKMAKRFAGDPTITVDETGHNAHLIRARRMQTRVVTMLTEYKRTGNRLYRDLVVKDVRRISEWEYWSWITWRQADPRPEAIFDLSYGENSTTLAIAFDGLRETLTDEELALFVATARSRSLKPYLAINGGREKSFAFGHPHSNWNTVCNGGAGMLALAMGELCPESGRVLKLVEASVQPFFRSLGRDGGWPEGIGYWNYGMRYGYMYLLSHERATGRKHPLLRLKGSEATLTFPLAFSPNGAACSFVDVNRFAPLPFHYAAADRFGRQDIVQELDCRLAGQPMEDPFGGWPSAAETLLLHPRTRSKRKAVWPRSKLVQGLDWGYLADRMPRPNLFVAVRGGTTDAPHVHRDLLSFFCVVGDEKLVENIPVDDYLDTTFSSRRFELYETSAASKNTILVNGVGVKDNADVETRSLKGRGWEGFRIDATRAMGDVRDGPATGFCGRAFLMLKGKAVLVVDRVELPFAGLVESRLHTFLPVSFGRDDAIVRGKRHRLHVSFAASEPTVLRRGTGLSTDPGRDPDTVVRLMSTRKVKAITMCTLLTPDGKGAVKLTERGARSVATVSGLVPARVGFDTQGLGL